MGLTIPVKRGAKIPLSAQETKKDATKVVKAQLYDMLNMTPLGSIVVLPHVTNGLYQNNDIDFPSFDVDYVLAQYLVFESDGTTPNKTGDQSVQDVFVADDADTLSKRGIGASDVLVEIENDGIVVEIESNDVEEFVQDSDFSVDVCDDDIDIETDNEDIEILED